MTKHRVVLLRRFLICLAFVIWFPACVSPYSTEALHGLNPGADIVDVCVRPPTVKSGAVVWAHNMTSGLTVSDDDCDVFEQAAKTASVIYRYDPNAPKDTPSRLPWPYQTMSCQSLSSWKTPPLPKGMPEIRITWETREALVATLVQPEEQERPSLRSELEKTQFDTRYMGQIFTGRARNPVEKLEAISKILRDTIRGSLPTVEGPSGEQISILDTKTGQIIGGVGAGASIGLVPGGAVIADGLVSSGKLPKPTREFMIGQGLGGIGVGFGQAIGGTGMALGGGGASLTGGGAIVGVPVCVGGIALATNGAITFYNGAKTIILAVCRWEELPSAADSPPLASTNQAPQSTGPAPAANQAKPPETNGAANAAKSAAQPVATKPAAKPQASTQSAGQTSVPPSLRRSGGTKIGKSTTTWVKCTGQQHHAISAKIHEALEDHPNLKGLYKYRDNRFVTQAIDKKAHSGYQTWHINLDKEVADWIDRNKWVTAKDFETYLSNLYAEPRLKSIFPNGF